MFLSGVTEQCLCHKKQAGDFNYLLNNQSENKAFQ
jgi:hypothetical protein